MGGNQAESKNDQISWDEVFILKQEIKDA